MKRKARKKWDEVKDEVLHWSERGGAARSGSKQKAPSEPEAKAKRATPKRAAKKGGPMMQYADED